MSSTIDLTFDQQQTLLLLKVIAVSSGTNQCIIDQKTASSSAGMNSEAYAKYGAILHGNGFISLTGSGQGISITKEGQAVVNVFLL